MWQSSIVKYHNIRETLWHVTVETRGMRELRSGASLKSDAAVSSAKADFPLAIGEEKLNL